MHGCSQVSAAYRLYYAGADEALFSQALEFENKRPETKWHASAHRIGFSQEETLVVNGRRSSSCT